MASAPSVVPRSMRRSAMSDLPAPGATPAVANRLNPVPKPENAWPKVPAGFKVERVAENLENPRQIKLAPNGDLFIAEERPGHIRVIRMNAAGKVQANQVFASDLRMPFGMAFYPEDNPRYLYVGNTDSVVRFPYKNGDLKASGPPEKIADVPGGRSFGGAPEAFGELPRDAVGPPHAERHRPVFGVDPANLLVGQAVPLAVAPHDLDVTAFEPRLADGDGTLCDLLERTHLRDAVDLRVGLLRRMR